MEGKQDDKLGPWLALFHARNLPLRTAHQLLDEFKTPQRILNSTTAELKAAGLKPEVVQAITGYRTDACLSTIEKDLSWREQTNHHIITFDDPLYPSRLKEIHSPPLLLYVVGTPETLSQSQLAMVGSRNPSVSGRDTAVLFARKLAESGLIITSGLALGIDAAGHMGALEAEEPTIAVMATGADIIYPKRHRSLAERVAAKGALVSEFPLGTVPRPERFPQRNRIISGLSLGVLVVEAAVQSGSLITARFALEQGREVFAIPGSIHNPMVKGCHALIRQGAKLVETVEDVLEEISGSFTYTPELSGAAPVQSTTESPLLDMVDYETTSMDCLVERSGLSVSELTRQLMALELNGQIQTVNGGYVKKVGI